jgi:hypothetical protein
LQPASAFLEMQASLSSESDCETVLMRSSAPVDIFHYSGHTDAENGMGYLLASDVNRARQPPARLDAVTPN